MPGASPYQAVEAFLAPIERALACLGAGKVVVSPGGRADTSKTHSWSLNAGEGLVLRGRAAGCRFLAAMHYRIIPTDPEKYDVEQGRWRVTTSAPTPVTGTPTSPTSVPSYGAWSCARMARRGDGLRRTSMGTVAPRCSEILEGLT